ncbi:unnamed protein product [Ophioblennius macclurei]
MEGRCSVDTWTQFGFSGARTSAKLLSCEPHVLISDGSLQVHVFNSQERKVTAVLHFPAAVTDLEAEKCQQILFVACLSGVYCVSLQGLLDRPSASSGLAELKISSESLVAEADGASSLLLAGSVLLALGQRDTSWLLTLYKTPTQTQSSRCEMLGSFILPLASADADGDTGSGPRRRPVLIYVHCGDASPPSTLPHGHFRLEPVLFKLLFGVEAALANSPVALCGLPDGRLGFVPLRLPGSRLRILHSLEQPVVFVAASLTAEGGAGHAQCLVALGEGGRLVLIEADKGRPGGGGGGGQLSFTEARVSAPVACGCVDEKRLYYSTGSDLLALDLSKGSSSGKGKGRDEEAAAALQRPTSLNVCRVAALSEPACRAAGGPELLVLSVRGHLQRIRLPVQRDEPEVNILPSTQVGHRLRDLLSAIGDVCERASSLETVIKSKNLILRRLNQVINISLLLAEEHPPIHEKPIRCHGRTMWSRLLQKHSLTLTCILDNSSPYVLEAGWMLSVTMLPLSLPVSAGGESPSKNFLFPFQRLSSGEKLEVSLPLAEAGTASFPLTVNCSLVFSLSSLLGDEEAGSAGSISFPLNTLMVDWLHSLQVSRPRAAHTAAPPQPAMSEFLQSCRFRHDGGGESASTPETYSACVQVSSALLSDTLMLKNSELDTKEQNVASENLCSSLLDWLLCGGGGGGVRMGNQEDKTDLRSSVVHARSLNGAAVKLSAAEVNAAEEPLAAIRVQIESCSIAAVCGLHHAVLCRIQNLLQRALEKHSSMFIQSSGLRRALQRAENGMAAALGAASKGQMKQHLLRVYRELRENPLLIM